MSLIPEYSVFGPGLRPGKRMPIVYNHKGEALGKFDPTHIVGSEVVRGVPSDMALDRANRVRDIVELSGVKVVTTDSIRFILDGLREVKIGEALSQDQLRSFRDHVLESGNTVAANEKVLGPIRYNLNELISETGDVPDHIPVDWEKLVYLMRPIEWRPRKLPDIDCKWDILERKTRRFTLIYPPTFHKRRDVDSWSSTSMTKEELVRELKHALTHSTSSGLTFHDLGISSTVASNSEALHTALTEYVETVTEIVVFYKVTLHVTLRAQRRFDVTERWGWVGDECPLQSYVPETIEYSLWGKMVEFEFDYVYRYARKGHTVEAATVAQEDLISWAEEQFILDLQRTRGHWMPELPPPHDAPPDIPFHL